MSDPNTITYQAGAIEHATGTLQSASASLEQCKADLTNVNALLAQQICATPYQPGSVVTRDASPGELITADGTCATHRPLIGN